MRKSLLGAAALALVLIGSSVADARPRSGFSFNAGASNWGGGYGVNYGTRIGNNGYLSIGTGRGYGYGYPGYGYGSPAYGYSNYGYGVPAYRYAYPAYGYGYSQPYYYGGGYRRGWGW